ncbi:aminopeptidase [Caldibacillus thermolactis]|jgi:aminopeptidase|uniref:Aminopeptidase n=1 Tax=Pallidibacillus thermolactis TaxID=251051 RepID=A0ABT2WFT4_9BACI|nr:aminopeptidase [Pallidibacillus thermolactis]MCU9594523.1 aminopeptidase [Pallidibacillus thermolactis]
MGEFQNNLEKYAELAVKVGVNIQKGQVLVVNGSIENAEFIRLIVKKAYEAGAKEVRVNWKDDIVTKLKYIYAADEVFDNYPHYQAMERNELAEQGAAFLSIDSPNPDLLCEVDPKRISKSKKAAATALKRFQQLVQSDYMSWSIVGAATQAWADKVFPEVPPKDRVLKLWDVIFKTCRIDQEDPMQAWKIHNEQLHKAVHYLNKKKYQKLHFTAPGTDLMIGLPKRHVWCGAGSINSEGIEFMANLPTEEVFTVPQRDDVNGYVTSTKPLIYGGNVIEKFTLKFENGCIVDVTAEKGEALLKELINTDDGSQYLGEVALVPNDSPISHSNLLFYSTLFDENASNHLAIGSGYAFCVEGGKQMSQVELLRNGVNHSIVHVDFMIGSSEMNIDGITKDGQAEPIFRNGNWAIVF